MQNKSVCPFSTWGGAVTAPPPAPDRVKGLKLKINTAPYYTPLYDKKSPKEKENKCNFS